MVPSLPGKRPLLALSSATLRRARFAARRTAWKRFPRRDPNAGAEGFPCNVARVRALRDELGPDAGLMIHGMGSWDAPFALQFARAIRELAPTRPEKRRIGLPREPGLAFTVHAAEVAKCRELTPAESRGPRT
jgi:hypothetical protein